MGLSRQQFDWILPFSSACVGILLIAAITAEVARADCGKQLTAVPDGLFEIGSGTVDSGIAVSKEVLASRKLVVEVRSPVTKLYSLIVARPDAPSYSRYCHEAGGVSGGGSSILQIEEAPMGSPVKVELTNIGHPGEQKITYRIYADLSLDWKLKADDLVRRPLYVYIFENAPLADKARAHIEEAAKIWRSVGIDFNPSYRKFTAEQVKQLIGDDLILEGCFGECDSQEGDWQERQRVQALKPHPDSFAVVFAKGTLGLVGSTRADPFRQQVYISEDVFQPTLGRTPAHELGHLLLGRGHTGNPNVTWTSGLMAADPSNATDISAKDAMAARERAKKLPN